MRESVRVRSPGKRYIPPGNNIQKQLLEEDLARRRLWGRIAVRLEEEGLVRMEKN